MQRDLKKGIDQTYELVRKVVGSFIVKHKWAVGLSDDLVQYAMFRLLNYQRTMMRNPDINEKLIFYHAKQSCNNYLYLYNKSKSGAYAVYDKREACILELQESDQRVSEFIDAAVVLSDEKKGKEFGLISKVILLLQKPNEYYQYAVRYDKKFGKSGSYSRALTPRIKSIMDFLGCTDEDELRQCVMEVYASI